MDYQGLGFRLLGLEFRIFVESLAHRLAKSWPTENAEPFLIVHSFQTPILNSGSERAVRLKGLGFRGLGGLGGLGFRGLGFRVASP